jgi:hypothetical protein
MDERDDYGDTPPDDASVSLRSLALFGLALAALVALGLSGRVFLWVEAVCR